jgi:hypothetical protein
MVRHLSNRQSPLLARVPSAVYGVLRFGLHASATTCAGWSFGLPPLPSFRAIQLMISPGLP